MGASVIVGVATSCFSGSCSVSGIGGVIGVSAGGTVIASSSGALTSGLVVDSSGKEVVSSVVTTVSFAKTGGAKLLILEETNPTINSLLKKQLNFFIY